MTKTMTTEITKGSFPTGAGGKTPAPSKLRVIPKKHGIFVADGATYNPAVDPAHSHYWDGTYSNADEPYGWMPTKGGYFSVLSRPYAIGNGVKKLASLAAASSSDPPSLVSMVWDGKVAGYVGEANYIALIYSTTAVSWQWVEFYNGRNPLELLGGASSPLKADYLTNKTAAGEFAAWQKRGDVWIRVLESNTYLRLGDSIVYYDAPPKRVKAKKTYPYSYPYSLDDDNDWWNRRWAGAYSPKHDLTPLTFDPAATVLEQIKSLTARTTPHGVEDEHWGDILQALGFAKVAGVGYYAQQGESSTMFCAHLDTADHAATNVTHMYKNGYLLTDGKTILGADNKAGVLVLFHLLLSGVAGHYWLFYGEERGRIGSTELAKSHAERLQGIQRAIAFDRRDTTSVITCQSGYYSCSEEFAYALVQQLDLGNLFELELDETGSYTDTASFVGLIPECTNISVGFQSEHTNSEWLDIMYLECIIEAAKVVNWESLPTVRAAGSKTPKPKHSFVARHYVANHPATKDLDGFIAANPQAGERLLRVMLARYKDDPEVLKNVLQLLEVM